MRIVHAADFGFSKDGLHLHNQTQKIHHGLIRLGHFVYSFSVNDRARMLSPIGHKTFGGSRTNKALLKTCQTVRPELLILGHAQLITRETLLKIREAVKGIRIALWYIDPLWHERETQHLRDRLDTFDALFCSTGGELLQAYARPHCPAAFLPSAVDAGIECYRAYETRPEDYVHDLLFFGSDKNEPERHGFLCELQDELKDCRLGFYGCLGNPLVFGWEKEQIICRSKMALNLSRRSDVALYSSCRIAELLGNGILTFTPKATELHELYSDNGLVFFENVTDLAHRVRHFLKQDEERMRRAREGKEYIHRHHLGSRVADFIISLTCRHDRWQEFAWANHTFLADQKLPRAGAVDAPLHGETVTGAAPLLVRSSLLNTGKDQSRT